MKIHELEDSDKLLSKEYLDARLGELHASTKEDLQREVADLHREMAVQTRWLVGTMIVLQIPTWVGMLQIWNFLATIATKLPR